MAAHTGFKLKCKQWGATLLKIVMKIQDDQILTASYHK